MSDEKNLALENRFGKHNFGIFITSAIAIAIIIVIISMNFYYSSGAAQLDLSRPGYVSVRAQANNTDSDFKNFPANGNLSVDILNDFKSEFNEQAQKVKKVDAFGGDPLSPSSLAIDGENINQ